MDPDHQSLDPDPELESPDIPKRVEIRLPSRIQGRNRNTSNSDAMFVPSSVRDGNKRGEERCKLATAQKYRDCMGFSPYFMTQELHVRQNYTCSVPLSKIIGH